MKPKKRQKICYNCDGQVDLEVIVCPFCGTDLLEEFEIDTLSEDREIQKSLSEEQTMHSLYPPPYQPKFQEEFLEEPKMEEEEIEEKTEKRSGVLPTFFLTLSGFLFVLSLLIFLFSTEGALHLRFKEKFSFFYLLLSFLFFYIGWKKLSKIEELD